MKTTTTILLLIAVVLLGFIAFNGQDKEPTNFGSSMGDVYTASSTVYTTTAGKAIVLTPRNEGRAWMTITNMTGTITYLALGNATTTPNDTPIVEDAEYTILVPASGMYTFDEDNRYTGAIIASSSAAVTLRVTEIY